ncbi:VirB2 family type IV secretion system major pilin TrwL [Bartonella sp. CB169]|uniref:VirB2 family type IV secretion system major pilin TrwL n=1 Tax=Bartonella sp. CB169 TaxID=3112257 RepID=UPI00300E26C5
MKQLKIFQSKISNNITAIAMTMVIFFMDNSVYAQPLQKAEGVLNALKGGLIKIIPIAATIILLCLAVSYAGRFIEKSTFVRWAIGVVIAGSAVEITTMLFNNGG